MGLTILSSFTNANSLNAVPLSCFSMKNQECKTRPKVANVNSNKPIFYPFSIKASKCSGNCNNINNPYAKICVPDVIKDLNVKVFDLMSRTTLRELIFANEFFSHFARTNFREGENFKDFARTNFRE